MVSVCTLTNFLPFRWQTINILIDEEPERPTCIQLTLATPLITHRKSNGCCEKVVIRKFYPRLPQINMLKFSLSLHVLNMDAILFFNRRQHLFTFNWHSLLGIWPKSRVHLAKYASSVINPCSEYSELPVLILWLSGLRHY